MATIIVPANIRGTADTRANVEFVTGDIRLDHYTSIGDFFFKTSILAEERQNGTANHSQFHRTRHRLHALRRASSPTTTSPSWASTPATVFTPPSIASPTIAIPTGSPTARPSPATPSAAPPSGSITIRSGTPRSAPMSDRMEGTSTDHLIPTGLRVGGGTQLQHGMYGQADATLGPVKLFGGLRHSFAGQDSQFLSPNGGFVVGKKSLRARGSVYRSFRAPTLNELYREFKAGNTDTLANPNLQPEKLWGAEAGFDWIGENSTFRVTAYRNSMDGLITNVTLSSSSHRHRAPARQRRRRAQSRRRDRIPRTPGQLHRRVEIPLRGIALRHRLPRRADPQAPGDRAIDVPAPGGTLASVGLRSYSYQFDDDLNAFRLPGYASVQGVVRQHLVRSLSAEAHPGKRVQSPVLHGVHPHPEHRRPASLCASAYAGTAASTNRRALYFRMLNMLEKLSVQTGNGRS